MWRHEDVWRTLGGGIDFVTGERIEDEYQLSRAAAEAEPPERSALVLAPLMHGAAQWGTLGGLFKGTTVVLLAPVRPPRRVGRRRASTGSPRSPSPATPWPVRSIDALRERRATTRRRSSPSRSTAAVFSPVVKDQLFELLPNLFISEAVGSSEGGFNGMRLVEKGKTADPTA